MDITGIVLTEYSKIVGNKDGRYLKLCTYADKLLRRNKISGRSVTPEDAVIEAVLNIAYGNRTWDREKEPDLFKFLFMIIRSCILNYSYDEKRIIKPDNKPADQARYDMRFQAYIEKHNLVKPSSIDKELEYTSIADSCLDYFKADLECSLVILDLIDGMQYKQIAEDLGITTKRVKNLCEKIRYKLRMVITDYKRTEANGKVDIPGNL